MNRNIKKIPFSRPSLGRQEIGAAKRVLRSGWITSGEENRLFEKEFASYIGSPYSLTVNSATSGLHLILEALDVGPGDKVATTAYTFTASAEIISYLGAIPVMVDIDEDYNISPEALRRTCEEHNGAIKAAIIVHIAGLSCKMDRILKIREDFGIAVVEDCAHAFPCKTERGYLGTLADGGVFSFYANKTITTGEGGMVVCSDEKLNKHMSIMRLHGIDRDVWNRYSTGSNWKSWQYDVVAPGFKYNLTNFQAAIGRVQLTRAGGLKDKRTAIAKKYIQGFEQCRYIKLPPQGESHSWHLFIIQLPDQKLRDELMKYLYDNHIGCSLHFIPLPALSYYKKQFRLDIKDFPQSRKKFETSISIPIFPDMSKRMINRVIDVINRWDKSQ